MWTLISTVHSILLSLAGRSELIFSIKFNLSEQSSTSISSFPNVRDNNCVSCYSKTVFEYSRTRREPVYSKTVRPFLNSDAHNYGANITKFMRHQIIMFYKSYQTLLFTMLK